MSMSATTVEALPLPLNHDDTDPERLYAYLRSTTGPALLERRALETPDDVAYAWKRFGVYEEVTFAGLWERAKRIGLGLLSMDVDTGDRVALMGDAFPEWTALDLGAQGIGAITYGIYPTSSPNEVRQLLEEGGAKVLIAENQEYVDKVLPLVGELPELVAVVAVDTTAMFLYEHDALLKIGELEQRGAAHDDPEGFTRRVRSLDPEAPGTIVWTSGTTSKPNGAVLGHGAHLASAATISQHYPQLARRTERTVAFLPPCHVFGRDVAITLPLFTRLVPYYGESVDDLGTTLYDVAPTVLFTVPRYMQKFASMALIGLERTSPLKHLTYRWARSLARRHVDAHREGRATVFHRLGARIARRSVFTGLLEQFGLNRVTLAVSAGAPLPKEIATLWQIWGVDLCDLYGQTEAGGGHICAQKPAFPEPGDLGTPPVGWQVHLADDGEILVHSEDLFQGYWQNPDATAETLVDGWLHTGDVGEWTDAGNLRLIDRKKDIITTAGGKTLSPTTIESALKSSPYVNEAMAIGHGRKYLTALVELDYQAVAEWADQKGILYRSMGALPQRAEVQELIQEQIEIANEDLARVEQVKKFRLLPSELDPEHEGDPVTPTRKVKRNLMIDRYGDLIEDMYGSSEEDRIRDEITG